MATGRGAVRPHLPCGVRTHMLSLGTRLLLAGLGLPATAPAQGPLYPSCPCSSPSQGSWQPYLLTQKTLQSEPSQNSLQLCNGVELADTHTYTYEHTTRSAEGVQEEECCKQNRNERNGPQLPLQQLLPEQLARLTAMQPSTCDLHCSVNSQWLKKSVYESIANPGILKGSRARQQKSRRGRTRLDSPVALQLKLLQAPPVPCKHQHL